MAYGIYYLVLSIHINSAFLSEFWGSIRKRVMFLIGNRYLAVTKYLREIKEKVFIMVPCSRRISVHLGREGR